MFFKAANLVRSLPAATLLVPLYVAVFSAGCASHSPYSAPSLGADDLPVESQATLYDFLRQHALVRHEAGSDQFYFRGQDQNALFLIDTGGRDVLLWSESDVFGTIGDRALLSTLRRGWIPLRAVERLEFERSYSRIEQSRVGCACKGAILVDLKPDTASLRAFDGSAGSRM